MTEHQAVRRMPSERRRVNTSLAIGFLAGIVAAFFLPWQLAVLTGWCVAAVILLLWIFLGVRHADAAGTAAFATREDDTIGGARVLLVIASLSSLVGVAAALIKAKHTDGWRSTALNVSSVVTVVLSWAVVHAVYMLRYAKAYYDGEVGGIDFQGDEGPPDYKDFAYLAFTIGMTYQVSDTNISKRDIRHAALRHALLSYVFGTVVVAMTINVLLGFIR